MIKEQLRNLNRRIQSLLTRGSEWRKNNIPDTTFIFILAFIIGILSGLGASCLHWLIEMITKVSTSSLESSKIGYIFLILPLIGILLTSFYSKYIAKDDMAHGTEKILALVKNRQFKIKRNLTYSPIIGCSLTLGLGGSAGAEGPIAYSGAAIGSNIGQMFGMRQRKLSPASTKPR